MQFRRFSPDDDSGGKGSDPASKAGSQDTGGTGDGGGGTGTGKAADAATTGDDDKKLTPDEQIANLTKELKDWKTKAEDYTKKYGDQTAIVGRLKKFSKAVKDNPRGVVEGIAKQAGFDIFFDKPVSKSAGDGDGGSGDGGNTGGNVGVDQDALSKVVNQQIQSFMSPVVEGQMAQKHDDWDGLAEEREMLGAELASNQLADGELLHFAARGRNLPDILTAHKEAVIKEYVADLDKKNQGQISGTGAGDTSKFTTKKAVETFDDLLKVVP